MNDDHQRYRAQVIQYDELGEAYRNLWQSSEVGFDDVWASFLDRLGPSCEFIWDGGQIQFDDFRVWVNAERSWPLRRSRALDVIDPYTGVLRPVPSSRPTEAEPRPAVDIAEIGADARIRRLIVVRGG